MVSIGQSIIVNVQNKKIKYSSDNIFGLCVQFSKLLVHIANYDNMAECSALLTYIAVITTLILLLLCVGSIFMGIQWHRNKHLQNTQENHAFGIHVGVPSNDTGMLYGPQTPSEHNRHAKFGETLKSSTMRSEASDANTFNGNMTDTDTNKQKEDEHEHDDADIIATQQYLTQIAEAMYTGSIQINEGSEDHGLGAGTHTSTNGSPNRIGIGNEMVNYTPTIENMGHNVEISMIEAYIDTDNQIVEGSIIINKNVAENYLTVSVQDDIETDDENDDDHDHERLTNTHTNTHTNTNTNTQTHSHDHFHSPSGNHLQAGSPDKHHKGQSTMQSEILNKKYLGYNPSFNTVDMWQPDFRAQRGDRDQEELFRDFLGSSIDPDSDDNDENEDEDDDNDNRSRRDDTMQTRGNGGTHQVFDSRNHLGLGKNDSYYNSYNSINGGSYYDHERAPSNQSSMMYNYNDHSTKNSFAGKIPALITKNTMSAGTINESKSVSYDWDKNKLKQAHSEALTAMTATTTQTQTQTNPNENSDSDNNNNKVFVKIFDPQSHEIATLGGNVEKHPPTPPAQTQLQSQNSSKQGRVTGGQLAPIQTQGGKKIEQKSLPMTKLNQQNTLTPPQQNFGNKGRKIQKRSLILKIRSKDLFHENDDTPGFEENLRYFQTLSKLNNASGTDEKNKDDDDDDFVDVSNYAGGANNGNNNNNNNNNNRRQSKKRIRQKSEINIGDWTHRDVCNWLKDELLADNTLSVKQITKILVKFEMNYISGHVLLVLDQELLESIGIDKDYIQEKILKLTNKLPTQKGTQLRHIPSTIVPTGSAHTSINIKGSPMENNDLSNNSKSKKEETAF